MAKAVSWRYSLLNFAQQKTLVALAYQLLDLRPTPAQSIAAGRLKRARSVKARTWLVAVAAGIVALLWWHLLLALGVGGLSALLVYRTRAQDWQRLGARLKAWFSGVNRQLTLAVATGIIAAVGTYGAIAIWLEVKNFWLTAAIVLQSLGLVALGLLGWWAMRSRTLDTPFDRLVKELTQPDPLKRLVAVHQLSRLAASDFTRRTRIAEYFRLMLAYEPEATVQNALLDGLEVADQRLQPGVDLPPLKISHVPEALNLPEIQR